jgi:hypothetical protein
MRNSFDSTPILTGEDAERFEEAIANPKPVSKEEFAEMEKSYAIARRMGMYTVDDLKCCGNCRMNACNFNKEVCVFGHDGGCCDKWEFDRILKEERLYP